MQIVLPIKRRKFQQWLNTVILRKQEQKDTSIKILNDSGITVNDEQEVERFWGNLFCTNWKMTLEQKKEMNGKGMTSEGQIFCQQEMSVAIVTPIFSGVVYMDPPLSLSGRRTYDLCGTCKRTMDNEVPGIMY